MIKKCWNNLQIFHFVNTLQDLEHLTSHLCPWLPDHPWLMKRNDKLYNGVLYMSNEASFSFSKWQRHKPFNRYWDVSEHWIKMQWGNSANFDAIWTFTILCWGNFIVHISLQSLLLNILTGWFKNWTRWYHWKVASLNKKTTIFTV